jgi:hypothetical protein
MNLVYIATGCEPQDKGSTLVNFLSWASWLLFNELGTLSEVFSGRYSSLLVVHLFWNSDIGFTYTAIMPPSLQ